ncbi:MAG TPA: ABC transporter permease [Candidatus Acidoferrum sp.]|nr:ABC transporter permease [Candidatus Acidoferrum sp.]
MRRLRAWFLRLGGLFHRVPRDRELAAEMESHLQLHIADNLRAGRTPDQARKEALMKLGGIEQTKEHYRERRGLPVLETLVQDIRYSLRMLRKNPGFTCVVVLTLALGIGANTAIFSIVNGVLLKPLPYADSARLAGIFLHGKGLDRDVMGNADFLALAEHQQAFEHVAAFSPSSMGFTLTGLGVPQMIPGTSATADFFSVLGVRPFLGRVFLPEEGKPGGPLAVVVSQHFWEEFLHADPGAVGRSLMLDGKSYTVVGVMPRDFHFGPHSDLWPVLQLQPPHERPPYWLVSIGRLKPGVSVAQASADASRIAKQVREQYPRSDADGAIAVPLKELFVGEVSNALLILLGAVTFILLIAVVNVANLQLSRAGSRAREMAVRTALGAGRARLMLQLLTESLILAILGSTLGLGVAYYGVRTMLAFSPDVLPRMQEVSLDGRVLLFTAAVAIVTGVLFGLVPAVRVARSPLGDSLKSGSRSVSSSLATRRTHNGLVIAEFALALIVLTGAGLLIRTLFELQAVSPGFRSGHILTALISLPDERYGKASQVVTFYDELLNRLRHSPGIENAAISLSLPPNLLELTNPFHIEGQTETPGETAPAVPEIPISDGYFSTLGVPLLRGRFFSDADRATGTHVLIINQMMAQRYFPRQDPIGKRVQTGELNPKADWYTIVGVVGNVKYEGLGEKDEAGMYVPYFDSGWCPWFVRSLYIVVRGTQKSELSSPILQKAVWALDNQLPLAHVRTMDQLLYDSVASSRFRAILFGCFAALGLVLAMIGIYGVMAYSVSQRTNEIGIRVALGAQRKTVLRMILRQGAALAFLGVSLGLLASFALSRVLKGLLFGVRASDPLTFAGVAALVLTVALAACYIPARRATRVDPISALRYE